MTKGIQINDQNEENIDNNDWMKWNEVQARNESRPLFIDLWFNLITKEKPHTTKYFSVCCWQ